MENEIIDKINKAESIKAGEIEAIKDQLNKALSDKEKADKKADKALEDNKPEKYSKAKEECRRLADRIEFYNIQLKKMESSSLFSADTEEIADQLQKALNETIDNTCVEAIKRMHEIDTILDSSYQDLKDFNDAMSKIYKNTNNRFIPRMSIQLSVLNSSVGAVKNNVDLSKYW